MVIDCVVSRISAISRPLADPLPPPIEAVATVLDDSHTADVHRAITNRYGIVGKLFTILIKLRGGAQRTVGLEIRPALAKAL